MTKAESTNLALEFLARNFETLASLAWPIVAIVGLMMFKAEIIKLMPYVKLKVGGNEMSFAMSEALAADARVATDEAPAPNIPPEELTRFERQVAISPYNALVDIRVEIEAALRGRARRVDLPTPSGKRLVQHMSSNQIINQLQKHNALSHDLAELLRELVNVGNMAAHDRSVEISPADALSYRRMADRAVAALNSDEMDASHSQAADIN